MNKQKPQIEIIEQPANCGIRFRYINETKKSGKVTGVNSKKFKKTYPSIRISNYVGPLKLLITCVTANPPHRQHPNILNKSISNDGVYCRVFISNSEIIELKDLKVYKSRQRDIKTNLLKRKEHNIDPTKEGFDHINHKAKDINLDRVRLCFQAFYENPKTKLLTEETEPVISDELFDRRDSVILKIHNTSTNNISSHGGMVMMFTSYISKDDIEVVMTVNNFGLKLEKVIDIDPPLGKIHRTTGILFHIPPYEYPNDREFEIKLRRPSDETTSSPMKFNYHNSYLYNTANPTDENR